MSGLIGKNVALCALIGVLSIRFCFGARKNQDATNHTSTELVTLSLTKQLLGGWRSGDCRLPVGRVGGSEAVSAWGRPLLAWNVWNWRWWKLRNPFTFPASQLEVNSHLLFWATVALSTDSDHLLTGVFLGLILWIGIDTLFLMFSEHID